MRVLGREEGGYYAPAPSPDGSKVAWIHRIDRDSKLVVMDLAISTLARSIETPGYTLASMDWFPDGRRMIVSFMDNSAPDRGFDLGLLDTETGRIRPLLDLSHYDMHPRISPDGRLLAFSANPTGEMDIFLWTIPADLGLEE